jgi:hypothetical protein
LPPLARSAFDPASNPSLACLRQFAPRLSQVCVPCFDLKGRSPNY